MGARATHWERQRLTRDVVPVPEAAELRVDAADHRDVHGPRRGDVEHRDVVQGRRAVRGPLGVARVRAVPVGVPVLCKLHRAGAGEEQAGRGVWWVCCTHGGGRTCVQ